MSYLALYRKYRPSDFNQFYGQKYVVEIIKNAISNNKLSHAYLFSGPRGTGKTTMAKLIAKIANCSNLDGAIACNRCDSCVLINEKSNPDIVEIDAASNNGVDEIRNLRDKVVLTPSVSKYKVYIIDEVHMLTMQAFNALLKTLEEPPAHVIFILATTELYKVPETIVSRCQCYEFERISSDDIVNCLNSIVEKENLVVSDEVFGLIADYCNGGMRDSINLLDKLCSCSQNVDKSLFYDVVGLTDENSIKDIIVNISNKNISLVFDSLEKLEKNGKNLTVLLNQMMNYLKDSIVNNKNIVSNEEALFMLEQINDTLNNIKYSNNILLSIEICFLKIMNIFKDQNEKLVNNDAKEETSAILESKIAVVDNFDIKEEKKEKEEPKQKFVKIDKIVINNAFALADKNLKQRILGDMKGFYDYIHNKEFSSYVSYFLDSNIEVVGEKDVIISTQSEAILENAYNNMNKLELLFNLVMGKYFNLAFVLEKDWIDLKNKYIEDKKNGINYEYIEKKDTKDDIIEQEEQSSLKENKTTESTKFAEEIFGSDIVEIK